MAAGTHAHKSVHKPTVHRRNLFESLYKQVSAGLCIGERPVGAALLNPEGLHQRIQAVVGNVLERNPRKGQGIPNGMVCKVDSYLLESAFQESGVETRVVSHDGAVADKAPDFSGQRRKVLGFVQLLLGDSRKALDKRPKLDRCRADQVIYGFCRLAVFKSHQGDFDDFVLVKFKARSFQIDGNKSRNVHENLTFSTMSANWESACSSRFRPWIS